MTNQFTKGDIIQGTLRGRDESYHPIIYFGEIDSDYFHGGMITHSNQHGNVRLNDNHFNQKIDNDPRPSYFVNNKLIKKQEWGPFHKIGELSEEGIQFINSNINGTTPQNWEDYTN